MSAKTAPGPRERLLAAGQQLFYARGASVGVDALLKEANVARRSLYEHFGGKDGLIAAVLRRASDEDLAWYEDALAGATEPRARLLGLFDRLDELVSDADFRGCQVLRDRPLVRRSRPSGTRRDRGVPAAPSRTPRSGARGDGSCPPRTRCRAAAPADRGVVGDGRHPGQPASRSRPRATSPRSSSAESSAFWCPDRDRRSARHPARDGQGPRRRVGTRRLRDVFTLASGGVRVMNGHLDLFALLRVELYYTLSISALVHLFFLHVLPVVARLVPSFSSLC